MRNLSFAASPLFPHTDSALFRQFCQWVCVDWAYMDTRAKTSYVFRDLIRLSRIPVSIQIW